MTAARLTWIALALCVGCARRDDRVAPAAGDTAKSLWDVAQAGDTTRDTTDDDDGRWDGCIGQADTIEVGGPTSGSVSRFATVIPEDAITLLDTVAGGAVAGDYGRKSRTATAGITLSYSPRFLPAGLCIAQGSACI